MREEKNGRREGENFYILYVHIYTVCTYIYCMYIYILYVHIYTVCTYILYI